VILPWCNSPSGPRSPHSWGFLITSRHTTLGRTPLYEWSARRRDRYICVKLGLSCWRRNVGWGCLRIPCWRRHLRLTGGD
jgi:hypothetical protein